MLFFLHYHDILWFACCRNNVSKVQGSKTLKQQRKEERKAAEARGDTRAWNSLFMRPDTVCFFKCYKMQTMIMLFQTLWSSQVGKSRLKFRMMLIIIFFFYRKS